MRSAHPVLPLDGRNQLQRIVEFRLGPLHIRAQHDQAVGIAQQIDLLERRIADIELVNSRVRIVVRTAQRTPSSARKERGVRPFLGLEIGPWQTVGPVAAVLAVLERQLIANAGPGRQQAEDLRRSAAFPDRELPYR